MIIGYLHIMRIAIAPDEAYPPLPVDADGMLTGAVPFQGFQPVARRRAQIVKDARIVQLHELSIRSPDHIIRISLDEAPLPRGARGGVGERSDHCRIISHYNS